MKWSVQIAKVAGIPVRIHFTFLLIVAWVAYAHYQRDPNLRAVGIAVLFLLVVFAIIVVHELSHALVARSYGIRTKDITLWPIGGVSNLERMPENPVQEFWIAIAGPAVNVALAIVLGALVVLTGGWSALLQLDFSQAFLSGLVWVNAALALFNLLPAFPMDGGRVLRALLSMAMNRVQATQLAAAVGKGMALLFAGLGLMVNPFLILIALFVWLGGSAEAAHAELKAMLAGHPVSHATTQSLTTVSPEESLANVARLLIHSSQRLFPVLFEGRVQGVLSEQDLLAGLTREGLTASVADSMTRELPTVAPSAPLLEGYELLQQGGVCCVLVAEEGRFVGVLSRAGVSAFLSVISSLRGVHPGAGVPGGPRLVGTSAD